MDDLTERLRDIESGGEFPEDTVRYRNPDGPEAADEIDRLRAALAEAERALGAICSDADRLRLLGPADSHREGLIRGVSRARSVAWPALTTMRRLKEPNQ